LSRAVGQHGQTFQGTTGFPGLEFRYRGFSDERIRPAPGALEGPFRALAENELNGSFEFTGDEVGYDMVIPLRVALDAGTGILKGEWVAHGEQEGGASRFRVLTA
jgi:hypothetical protein